MMNPSCFAVLILLGSSLFTYAAAEEPSEADFEFGRDQVAMFASDRPGAAKVLESSPALKKWLVEAFAEKPLGARSYWDDPKPQGSNAAHLLGQRGAYPFLINVASGNITGRSIEKDEFVRRTLQEEHPAKVKVAEVIEKYRSELPGLGQCPTGKYFLSIDRDFSSYYEKWVQSALCA